MRKVLYMFSELSDTDIEWLASAGRRIGFAKGEVLIEEGRPPSDIFVLLEGELSVVTRVRPDNPIATLYQSEIVGELNDPRQSRGLISVSPSKGPVKSRLKAADAPTPCSAPPNAAPPAPAAKCIPA